MVITSIKAFLQLDTDFDIQGFTDPEAAARYATENPVDVVVSDYLMPKMNGIELLGRIKEVQPETSRVLLTGHADKQSAIQAINQVALFQYLEKPWDNAQLLLVVKSGAERTRLFRDLREKVGELDSAHSSLKTVQQRLLQAFL
jgi:response regulator RpfG family c-di-GMP phosphodiesterase